MVNNNEMRSATNENINQSTRNQQHTNTSEWIHLNRSLNCHSTKYNLPFYIVLYISFRVPRLQGALLCIKLLQYHQVRIQDQFIMGGGVIFIIGFIVYDFQKDGHRFLTL